MSTILRTQQDVLIGHVTREYVRVSRLKPYEGNFFKPFFTGNFIQDDNHSVLVGRFSMHPVTQVTLSIMSAIFVISGISFLLDVVYSPNDYTTLLSAAVAFATPLTFVLLVRWYSQPDVDWIIDKLKQHLSQ